MFAANLDAHPDTTFVPNVVFPGATFAVPVTVGNHGDSAATDSFSVGARLVPVSLDGWFAGSVTYTSPGFVELGASRRTADLAAGAEAVMTINAIVPVDLSPGLYALVVKSDIFGSVSETSESDNEAVAHAVALLSSDGVMVIPGSSAADNVRMVQATLQKKPAVSFQSGDDALKFRISATSGFNIPLGEGDDLFIVEGFFNGVTADGGEGNDRMVGGDGPETLIGGAGKDVLYGGLGNDRLNGNGGNDKLLGEGGADRLYGYAGNDYLDGSSSSDRLDGGAGLDTMLGQSGNDKFFAEDGEADELYGGSGTDSAFADGRAVAGNSIDILSSVESSQLVDDVP
jgi:Ca2+-binding RTX toxin-like protein